MINGKHLGSVLLSLALVLFGTTACTGMFPPTKATVAQQAVIAQVNRTDAKTTDLWQRQDRLEAVLKELRQQQSTQEATLKELRQQNGVLDAALKELRQQNSSQEATLKELRQQNGALDAALKELRQQNGSLVAALKELRQQHSVLEAAQNAATSQFALRVAKVEASQRETTGAIEEANHAALQNGQKIERMNSDVSFRLDRLDRLVAGLTSALESLTPASSAASAAPATPPPSAAANSAANSGASSAESSLANAGVSSNPGAVAGAPLSLSAAVAVPKPSSRKSDAPAKSEVLTAKKQFAQALDAYDRGKLDRAQSLFENFIEDNPGHEKLPEAALTLGKILYDSRQFANASTQLFAVYEKYPRSPYAAESLYLLGLTLNRLSKPVDGCRAFGLVLLDYPKSDKALIAKATAARDRFKCR